MDTVAEGTLYRLAAVKEGIELDPVDGPSPKTLNPQP
jgi:hypothetical protein